MEQLDRIEAMLVDTEAMLTELLTRTTGAATPVAPPPQAYPAMVRHKGVLFNLRAALNPDYDPSMTARAFGTQGSFVQDPSNANEGEPTRSAGGYPLFYLRDGWNNVISVTLQNGEHRGFKDEAEIAAWRTAVAARDANLDRVGGRFSPQR